MTSTPVMTDTLPDGLPPAAELIEAMRRRLAEQVPAEQVAAEVTAAHPALGIAAPAVVLAEWLGIKPDTIWVARTRKTWPEPDGKFGKTSLWKFSTAALGRAAAPGRGWATGKPPTTVGGAR